MVIDAAGPFRPMATILPGCQAAIAAGAHYLDLADDAYSSPASPRSTTMRRAPA